jgi:hypothetical protein
MRTLSLTVILIGLCLGVFALMGLYSQREFGGFLGLSIVFLQINLLMGIFILASGLAIMLYAMAQDRVIERAARREADTAEGKPPIEDIPLCPSCLTPAKLHQHFCMNCWTPLTSHAEIDPLGQVYAIGDIYWKLAHGPSKPIAIIGLCVIGGPTLLASLAMTIAFAYVLLFVERRSWIGNGEYAIELLSLMGGGLLSMGVLYVVTAFFVKVILNRHRHDPQEKLYSELPQETQLESEPDDSGD